MVEVYTSRIPYAGPDRLDITVKGQHRVGRVFAPSWDIVMGHKQGRYSDNKYTNIYHEMMLDSYRKNRAIWDSILNRDRIVLCCYCRAGKFCHRYILAGYLEKLGGKYIGEIYV